MAKIGQYTSQRSVNPTGGPSVSAVDFGANTGLRDLAAASSELSEKIQRVEQQRVTRESIIQRTLLTDDYQKHVFDEYARVRSEEDIVNPGTAKQFSQGLRQKSSEIMADFQGTDDEKVRLFQSLQGIESQYSQQIRQDTVLAQRKFIMNKAGEQVEALAQEVYNNPGDIAGAYSRLNDVLDEFAPAMYGEDEIDFMDAAQEQIAVKALYSYVDSAQYDEAKQLIEDNPFFMDSLTPDTRKKILSEIKSGIDSRDKSINEMRDKINAVNAAAGELGVEIPGTRIFSAVTGIQEAQTPAGKVEEFQRLAGLEDDKLTPSVIAKIAYGVDLPSESDIDFNKEYTPAGALTPKGIAGKIKVPFESAAAARMYQTKVLGAINQFRNDGNKQALLTAMISFQKALDEGAIVREGDIVLQREAQGLSDRVSIILKPGQVVGDELVDEMEASMNEFTSGALKSSKTFIDPFIEEAKANGYRDVDYGIPASAYQDVFAGIQGDKPKDGGTNKNTMTADEFLAQ